MINSSDLLKRVRKIEIKTRGLSRQLFAGEYHSAFKGKGMAFSEVREYSYGDDVRNIDWNVTARFDKPYVKVFEEERELTVMLLVDISASKSFGTAMRSKQELMAELAATLAFSASQNNDKVGLILFSDKVEKFIPPKKGRQHILRLIRELLDFEPQNKLTDIAPALQYFSNIIKKRSTAFLISDFISPSFETPLKIAARRHDLVALQIIDPHEVELPNIGLAQFQDAENQEFIWIDTSNKEVRKQYHNHYLARKEALNEIFRRSGIDSTTLFTNQDYVIPLMKLFKQRS